MKEQIPQKTHLLYLDGLRALAAIFIIAHHSVLQFYDFNTEVTKSLTGFKKMIVMAFLIPGHFAVDLFIVLSGFCLMIPVVKSGYQLKGGALFFYKKRALRIIPTYYIAIGFSLLLIWLLIGKPTGTHWDVTIPVTKKDILRELLFIHDCFYDSAGKINHVFWSVVVETRIYILFPLLVFVYKKLNALGLILLSAITSAVIFYFMKYVDTVNNIFPLETAGVSPYLILFTFGMIGSDICFGQRTKTGLLKKLPWNKAFLAATVLVVLANVLLHPKITTWQEVDVVVGFWAMCLLIVGYKQSLNPGKAGWINQIISWQPLVFCGMFAYSIYLTHAPLIQVITQYIIFPMHLSLFASSMVILLISLPVCIGFAYLFFILFERPFLNVGKKLTLKATEANAAINPAI